MSHLCLYADRLKNSRHTAILFCNQQLALFFFPLIPLRKGQGKAPLQNKLVSQKGGSSADGFVVLSTLVQL